MGVTALALVADREPWHQQPWEPDAAYTAFVAYHDLGRTRTARAVRQAGTPVLVEWVRDYLWVERAAAWDRHLQDLQDARLAEQRASLVKDHLEGASALRRRAREAIERAESSRTINEAGSAFETATRMERLAVGLPTQVGKRESEMRRAGQESLRAQEILAVIIRSHLCDGCRDAVMAELGRAEQARENARELLS